MQCWFQCKMRQMANFWFFSLRWQLTIYFHGLLMCLNANICKPNWTTLIILILLNQISFRSFLGTFCKIFHDCVPVKKKKLYCFNSKVNIRSRSTVTVAYSCCLSWFSAVKQVIISGFCLFTAQTERFSAISVECCLLDASHQSSLDSKKKKKGH